MIPTYCHIKKGLFHIIHTLPEGCNVYVMGQISQSYRLKLHILNEELVYIQKFKKQPMLKNSKNKRNSHNNVIMLNNVNMLNINRIMQNKNGMYAGDK